MLLEPTTVVAKAWEMVKAVGQRSFWEPQNVLVTGAGPIGLLAALGGVLNGLDVHVLDRATSGSKPDLVKALGATYHSTTVSEVGFEPDIIIECTGAGQVISESLSQIRRWRHYLSYRCRFGWRGTKSGNCGHCCGSSS